MKYEKMFSKKILVIPANCVPYHRPGRNVLLYLKAAKYFDNVFLSSIFHIVAINNAIDIRYVTNRLR